MKSTSTHIRFKTRITGEGPLLLLLPGLGLNLHVYDLLVAKLAAEYQCLCMDYSGKMSPAQSRNCTIESIAQELATYLQQHGLAPFAYIGHSLGGFIGMRLAMGYPALVQRLVLIAVSTHTEGSLFNLFLPPEIKTAESLLRHNMEQCVASTFRQTPAFEQGVIAQLAYSGAGHCFMPLLRAAAQFDVRSDLHQITCPTLIVHGDEDALVPASQFDAMKKGILSSQAVVLPQTGHIPQLEKPDQTAAAVRAFLQKQSKAM